MTEKRKAGAIIIENLGMFDEAKRLFDKIEEEVFDKVDAIVEDWVKENGWAGECDFYESDTWIAHPDWIAGENGEYWARLFLNYYPGADPEVESEWLSDLCGESQVPFGFCFEANYPRFGGKAKWKNFCKSLTENNLALKEAGFNADGKGGWFLPVKLNKGTVANAYENEDYDEAMKPVFEALEKLEKARPVFDGLLEKAKSDCVC